MKRTFAVMLILAMTAALVFASGGQQSAAGGAAAPVKLTVELFDRGTDGGRSKVDDNAWTQWIKAKVLKDLNIDVTFIPVVRFPEDTTIPTLMAAGTAPDLCYTYSSPVINNFRDLGGIMDLTPYVDRLLPDLKKALGEDPVFVGKDFIWRNQQPSDGKMYSIPSMRITLGMRNVFIRKDWLDKLGLPLPTNYQQFHDALVAFRDKDPGNVGVNNVIPIMTSTDVRWELANFMNPFITPGLSDRDRYINSYINRANFGFPGYKEGVRLMNTWYNEGLIYRDFPLIRTTDENYNILKSGYVGAFCANWDLPYRTDYKIMEDVRRNAPGADFVPVDCFPNANGVTEKDMYDKVGLQIFVPSFAKEPEAALKYLNWLAIQENLSFIQIGNVGVNHQITNGVPEIITRPANDPWIQNSSQNIDFTMPFNGVIMPTLEESIRVVALSYPGIPAEVVVNAYNLSVKNGRAPVVVPLPETQMGIYGTTLNEKVDALLAQAITARPADFDRIYDAGLADLNSSGGQAIKDERTQIANNFFK